MRLPLKIGSGLTDVTNNNYYREIIKRGKTLGDKHNDGAGTPSAPSIVNVTAANADTTITALERLSNKTEYESVYQTQKIDYRVVQPLLLLAEFNLMEFIAEKEVIYH